MLRNATGALLIALAWLFMAASPAAAAQRYASPTGAGPQPCADESNPCSIFDAIEDASVGAADEVVLAPGNYDLAGNTLDINDPIQVHGTRGGPFPVLASTAGNAVEITVPDAVLSDVLISHTGSGVGLVMTDGVTERVITSTTGTRACEVGTTNALTLAILRSSVCSGGSVAAVRTSTGGANVTATLRNVSAYAQDGGFALGVVATAAGGGTATIDARNVVANGPGFDVQAQSAAGDGGGIASVQLENSNYQTEREVDVTGTPDSVTDPGSGTNQTAQARFLPFITFQQAFDSPTINAGGNHSLLGNFDLGGGPRIEGSAPDIGADEADGTVPETTITDGPSGTTSDNTPTFTFTSSEPASFTCRIDGGTWEICSGPDNTHTTAALADGQHTFEVAASDFYNIDPTPASRTFTVSTSGGGGSGGGGGGGATPDNDPPETTITRGPPDETSWERAKFRFTSDEAASTFECRLDRGAYAACTSPRRYRNLDDGRHRFRVRAIDAAGNADPSAARDRWVIG